MLMKNVYLFFKLKFILFFYLLIGLGCDSEDNLIVAKVFIDSNIVETIARVLKFY